MTEHYLVGLDLTGRRVVVIGGGTVAQRRLVGLLAAGADVEVVAPEVTPAVEGMATAQELRWTARRYRDGDLDGAWYAVACADDPAVNAAVADEAQRRRIFCVRADDAPAGSAVTPAVGRHDGLTVGVLAGRRPRRSAAVRTALVEALQTGLVDDSVEPVRPGVALVGGGPGDPELITVRGRRLLARADVVITDRLGPRDLLDSLAAHVEVIDAAKIPYGRAMNQARINELLVEHVRAGKFVVRLKGGDPFVFGRGFEEVLACAEAGVPVTVVPGVTSAFAAPAVADVPVSHRGVAHEIVVVSGHVPPGDPRSLVDWPALARLRGTLVLLMAVERVGLFAEALIEGGRPADTPVAVVQDGTMRIQRSVRATLATVAAAVQEQGIRPPAVVVIGQVAGLVPGRVTDHLDREEPNVAEAKGSLLDLTVRDLLDVLAAGTPAPGGGGAAALVTAMAAALAGMASRFGDGSAATRSDDLRHRAAALADADAVAYEAFLTAVRLPHEDPGRPAAVADARRDAIGVPAEIGELAAEVAELAAGLARDGNPRLRGDAVAAVRIAAAAAGTAAELVAANVHGEEGVAELERVRVFATAARDHATELNPD